jgi:hypothetical protein
MVYALDVDDPSYITFIADCQRYPIRRRSRIHLHNDFLQAWPFHVSETLLRALNFSTGKLFRFTLPSCSDMPLRPPVLQLPDSDVGHMSV